MLIKHKKNVENYGFVLFCWVKKYKVLIIRSYIFNDFVEFWNKQNSKYFSGFLVAF